MRIHVLAVACAMSAATATTAPAGAQSTGTPPASTESNAANSALIVSTAERAQVARAVAADARVQRLVGPNPRVIVGEPIFDKNEPAGAAAPGRHIPVVLFNPRTNRAATALSSANGQVSNVASIAAVLVPFTTEDLNDALTLVRRNAAGNRISNLDQYRPDTGAPESSDAYVAQFLPVRGGIRSDPCYADRCADVIFRSPSGYLPLRAHTDLTKRTVQIEGVRR